MNCFLVGWMFQTPSLKNKINHLYEHCLRMIYNDKHSNFEEMLAKNNSVSIHHSNIKALSVEMYKVAIDMYPEIANDIFKLIDNTHYHLRHT